MYAACCRSKSTVAVLIVTSFLRLGMTLLSVKLVKLLLLPVLFAILIFGRRLVVHCRLRLRLCSLISNVISASVH